MYLRGQVNTLTHCKQSLLLSSLSRRQRGSGQIASSLWGCRSPNFWGSQSFFLFLKLFFENEHPFNVKPLVIAEPAVANTRILGLGSNILATYRACSTDILLDSSTVFLEYTKIEQAKEGFCCQGDTLINTIKLTLLKVKESSETIIYLN